MGVYDRDYYRDESRGFVLGGDMSVVSTLILVNAVVFLVDVFSDGRLSSGLGLQANIPVEPWKIWQLVSYGFAHDHHRIWHILGNMFFLWLFGRDVESLYGRKVFLQLYLSLIVLSGAVWVGCEWLTHRSAVMGEIPPKLIGASGGVTGIMLVFVLHYPTRKLLFWGVLPVPVWALASLQVLQDIQGAVSRTGNVAYTAHLGGAAFGYLFYRTGWQLGRIWPSGWSLSRLKARPSLKVHREEEEDLGSEVDRILEKISRDGEASLSKAERRTLERASRKYQQRRN